MNNNEEKQNIEVEKKQKKSFLSNFVEIESKEKVVIETKNIARQEKEVKKIKIKAEIDDESQLSDQEKLLLHTGAGVNLIPKKSKAEVVKAKKKFSFNVSSMVSLLLLVVLSLSVVLFNIVSKQQLNSATEDLFQKESELEVYGDMILSNNEILERIDLYKHLEQGVFSPKEIVVYVMTIVDRSGSIVIRTFDIGNDLGFEMSGSTSDLAVVAKLWYLLGIDENIDNINLESVGKSDKGASFSFKGQLNTSNFIGD
ncbi:hypothetical protein K8R14_03510 [bacterium]|nr:hypothetical protein [bacterium]